MASLFPVFVIMITLCILSLFTAVQSETHCTNTSDNICTINRWNDGDDNVDEIFCDDDHSQCIINCNGVNSCRGNNSSDEFYIHCPLSGTKCIINCYESCSYSTILSYSTKSVEINIIGPSSMENKEMQIYSPNNGKLSINVTSGIFSENIIYSSLNTKTISMNCHVDAMECNNNIINGTLLSNELYFNCADDALCQDMDIYCPLNDAYCTILCDSQQDLGCKNMFVFSVDGLNDINNMNYLHWRCDDENELICYYSKLFCNDNYHQQSSFYYDHDINRWILDGECDNNHNHDDQIYTAFDTTNYSDPRIITRKEYVTSALFYEQNELFYIVIAIFLLITCLVPICYIAHYKRKKKKDEVGRERSATFRQEVNKHIQSMKMKPSIDQLSIPSTSKKCSFDRLINTSQDLGPINKDDLLRRASSNNTNDEHENDDDDNNNTKNDDDDKQTAFIDDGQSFKSLISTFPSVPTLPATHNHVIPPIPPIGSASNNKHTLSTLPTIPALTSTLPKHHKMDIKTFNKMTSLDFANLPTAVSNSSYVNAVMMKQNLSDLHNTTLSEMEMAVIAKIPAIVKNDTNDRNTNHDDDEEEEEEENNDNDPDEMMDDAVKQIQDHPSIFSIDNSILNGNHSMNHKKRINQVAIFENDGDDDDIDNIQSPELITCFSK